MKNGWRRRWRVAARSMLLAAGVAGLLSGPTAGSARAQNTFGTLSNFDVFNDTGEDCHGFEIELEGISSADVTFTFGSPYQRYGNPTVEDVPGGALVRYASPYDANAQVFTAATPQAPAVITPTNGHACWTGGSGDYLTSGCEHFGLGLRANATQTIYRWLVADPAAPGMLRAAATKVSIPAPSWSAQPAPQGGNPVVRAVIPAEPPEVEAQYGDAVWVKVFVTESEEPARLEHLVSEDPAVPDEASETEIEWVLLQAKPGGGAENELASEGQLGAGKKSVTRRYEFYEYTGAYDPEDHEALCGGDGGCDQPQEGDLGNYLGAQMAAFNLEELGPVDTPTPTATEGVAPTLTPGGEDRPTATVAPGSCAGDCDGSGMVVVAELIRGVRIALELAAADECAAVDVDGSGTVSVAELITAVGRALAGCD